LLFWAVIPEEDLLPAAPRLPRGNRLTSV